MKNPDLPSSQAAQAFGLKALTWLLGEDEILPVFLGATGVGEADIRTRIDDPVFLASVLDFIMMDDNWVIACAHRISVPPESFIPARAALPGANVHWT